MARCSINITGQIAGSVHLEWIVQGKEEYKKRKKTVDWPFGNIKQNLGLREFLTKGVKNVKNEFNLVCISHNLTVLWGKMVGNMDVLC